MWILVLLLAVLLCYIQSDWLGNLVRLILLSLPKGVSILSTYDSWTLHQKRQRLCKTIKVVPSNVFPNHQKELLTTTGHSFVQRSDGYTQHVQSFVFTEDTLVSYEVPHSELNVQWFASYPKNVLVAFPPYPLTTYWEKPLSTIQTFKTTKGRILSGNEIIILKGLAGPLQRLGQTDAKYIKEMFEKQPAILFKEESKKPLSRSEQRDRSRLEKVQTLEQGEEKLLIVRDNGEIETFNPQVF